MIIKKIIDVCKKKKAFVLCEDENGVQWLSDGAAMFPLYGLPQFCEETIFRTFDIPEKQQKKMHFSHKPALPSDFNFKDYFPGEKECARQFQLITGASDTLPYNTTQGIKFIHSEHLLPLADAPQLTICERVKEDGTLYFAAKSGFVLLAIITPFDVITEDFTEQLRNFSLACEKAFDNKRKQEIFSEQEKLF